MKNGIINRIISSILAAVFLISAPAVLVNADDATPGKYVSEVFIAYGKTKEDAEKWLTDNGWEPIKGENDFTAGKNSTFDSAIVTAMGIRRTNEKDESITDMAIMNMTGGYSFPDYKGLLDQKKAEIDEFINTFIPILEEYKSNYNGAESSGAAVLMLEITLALATDTGEESWTERAGKLTGNELSENIANYIPEASNQDLAPSAITNLLGERYGDTAAVLCSQWGDINERMRWYEDYNNKNDLWQHDGEDEEAYASRQDILPLRL